MSWRATAPGKVNLGLMLGPTRPADGRHELVTVFEPLSLADTVTLTPGAADEVHCPGVSGENLALAALRALRAHGWAGPPVRVEIEKRIPVAGGMAGGSANAGAVLRLAAALEPVAPEALRAVAASLGADVPAQVSPGLWLGTGAGEALTPLPPLAPHSLVILPQPLALSTAAVFTEADRLGLGRPAGELAARATALRALAPGAVLGPGLLVNDLEPATVSLHPPAGEALDALRRAGADAAFVCGSGPTVAGLWWDPEAATAAADRLGPPAVPARPVTGAFSAPTLWRSGGRDGRGSPQWGP